MSPSRSHGHWRGSIILGSSISSVVLRRPMMHWPASCNEHSMLNARPRSFAVGNMVSAPVSSPTKCEGRCRGALKDSELFPGLKVRLGHWQLSLCARGVGGLDGWGTRRRGHFQRGLSRRLLEVKRVGNGTWRRLGRAFVLVGEGGMVAGRGLYNLQ